MGSGGLVGARWLFVPILMFCLFLTFQWLSSHAATSYRGLSKVVRQQVRALLRKVCIFLPEEWNSEWRFKQGDILNELQLHLRTQNWYFSIVEKTTIILLLPAKVMLFAYILVSQWWRPKSILCFPYLLRDNWHVDVNCHVNDKHIVYQGGCAQNKDAWSTVPSINWKSNLLLYIP